MKTKPKRRNVVPAFHTCPRCGRVISPWQVFCGPCGPATLKHRRPARKNDKGMWIVKRRTTASYLGAYEWVRSQKDAVRFGSRRAALAACKTASEQNSDVRVVRLVSDADGPCLACRKGRHTSCARRDLRSWGRVTVSYVEE